MQRPQRLATIIVIGAWLGACSGPANHGSGAASANRSKVARDVRLAAPALRETAVASDLEVGRPTRAVSSGASHVMSAPTAAKATVALLEVPKVLPAAVAVTERFLVEVAVPESHTIFLAPTGEMESPAPVHVAAGTSLGGDPLIGHEYGGSRGPSIIIRGGMGGVDDKCDLRPRGFGGGAINRLAPPLGLRGGRSGGIR